jgi:hypothetical protein
VALQQLAIYTKDVWVLLGTVERGGLKFKASRLKCGKNQSQKEQARRGGTHL